MHECVSVCVCVCVCVCCRADSMPWCMQSLHTSRGYATCKRPKGKQNATAKQQKVVHLALQIEAVRKHTRWTSFHTQPWLICRQHHMACACPCDHDMSYCAQTPIAMVVQNEIERPPISLDMSNYKKLI